MLTVDGHADRLATARRQGGEPAETYSREIAQNAQVEDVEDAIAAYEHFDERDAGWLKVELAPA